LRQIRWVVLLTLALGWTKKKPRKRQDDVDQPSRVLFSKRAIQ
jgi:hypothetical protein